MTFSNFAYGPLFSAAAQLVVTAFVWRRAPSPVLARSYALFGGCLALWCAGVAATFIVDTPTAALRWLYILHVGVLFLPATILQLSLDIAGVRGTAAKAAAYLATFGLLLTFPFGKYIVGVTQTSYAWFAVAGPGFKAFGVFMPLVAFPTAAMIGWRRRSERVNKTRYSALMIATLLMTSAGIHDCLPLIGVTRYPFIGLTVYPWGTFGAILYGSLFAYATLQEHSLDVRFRVSSAAAVMVRLVITFAVGFVLLFGISSVTTLSPFEFGAALVVLLVAAGAAMALTPGLLSAVSESLHAEALAEGRDHRGAIVRVADTILTANTYDTIWAELRQALSSHSSIDAFVWVVAEAKSGAVLFGESHPYEGWATSGIAAKIAVAFGNNEASFVTLTDRRNQLKSGDQAELATTLREFGTQVVFNASGTPDVYGALIVGRKRGGYSPLDFEMFEHLAQRLGIAAQRVLVTGRASLAERHELLSLMGQGLAHDLQNLVVPVRTFVDVLGRSTRLSDHEHEMQIVAAENLASIRAYLSNAVLFGADMKVRATETDTATIIGRAAAATAARATSRSVTIEHEGPVIRLYADAVLLERVVANLLANAIDASQVGGVVEVLTSERPEDDTVEIRVCDRGEGVAPAIRASLFQPYVTTKGGGGTGPRGFGLGLALCQMIVGLHRGTIRFEPRDGGGTTFIARLPQRRG